jgi:hypothetical protein
MLDLVAARIGKLSFSVLNTVSKFHTLLTVRGDYLLSGKVLGLWMSDTAGMFNTQHEMK